MTRFLFPIALTALLLALQPVPANATDELNFCSTGCEDLSASNQSGVAVTKVTVTQLPGPNNCEEVSKTHTQNLTLGETATIKSSTNCPYRVRFSTTSGCSGDKTATLDLEDRAEGKKWVMLKGTCFKLKTVKQGPVN